MIVADSVNWGGSCAPDEQEAAPDEQEALPDDEAPRAGVGRRRGRPRKVPENVGPPANKKQRQTKLQCNVLPAREDITILAGAKPVAGRGSALVTGHAGRKVDWVHAHWKPQDSEKYKDISMAELPSKLHSENPMMRCDYCDNVRRYNPSTHFKVHLLTACPGFRISSHWNDVDVRQELALRTSKVSSHVNVLWPEHVHTRTCPTSFAPPNRLLHVQVLHFAILMHHGAMHHGARS